MILTLIQSIIFTSYVTFLLIKFVGLLLICFWIPSFADFIRHISSQHEARQIANSHTVLSFMMTIVLLPFANTIPKFIEKIVTPSKKKKAKEFNTKYLDDTMLATPAIALSLAKNETVRMSSIVKEIVEKILDPFVKHDGKVLNEISSNESKIDYLRQSISDYITKISQEELHDDQVQESFRILYTVTELEEIGDIVSEMLVPKAEKWIESNADFSEEGKKEITEFHSLTLNEFDLAIEAFEHMDQAAAHKVKKNHKKIKEEMNELKLRHFERLSHNVPESIQSSNVHMELIGSLKGINSHSTNIGKLILKTKNNHKENKES